MTIPETNAYNTAEAVARRSYGRLVAFLAARTHDVGAAEDALSEAFAAALADWPRNGCPANPEAWLLTVARRKIIDTFRSQLRHEVDDEGLSVTAEVPRRSRNPRPPSRPHVRLRASFHRPRHSRATNSASRPRP